MDTSLTVDMDLSKLKVSQIFTITRKFPNKIDCKYTVRLTLYSICFVSKRYYF